jgi:hypothetical protein
VSFVMEWQPFPLTSLPESIRTYTDTAARAIGCDPSYVALPLLAGLAAAIGNSRTIRLKRGWTEPALLWAIIIGHSGTLKSPAADAPLQAIRRREARAIKENKDALAKYAKDHAAYEAELADWKRGGRKKGEEQPTPPELPVCPRFWCSDTTVEALAHRLASAPRGLLLHRDELAGWLGSFDQYKAGKADTAHWLTMHGARTLIVDRKTGDKPVIHIPHAAVSITGGIQPEVLARALGREHYEDGLAARLLLAMPPRKTKRWSEVEIDPETESTLADVYGRLYDLHLPMNEAIGEPEPIALDMTPEGKQVWVAFYNAHAQEQAKLTGDLAAAWSKLEGYAARLALVVHLVRQVAGGPDLNIGHGGRIDDWSMAAGITLARWFAAEARRVYAVLSESEEARARRELVELIREAGGTITARDLMRRRQGEYPTAEDADHALMDLVTNKLARGKWVSDPEGGRPYYKYRLESEFSANGGHDK